jgi:hypothetical protein
VVEKEREKDLGKVVTGGGEGTEKANHRGHGGHGEGKRRGGHAGPPLQGGAVGLSRGRRVKGAKAG